MAELWTEIKRRLKTSGAALLAAGGALLLAIAYLFTKRNKERPRSTTLDPLLEHTADMAAAANARAAIEIAVARSRAPALIAELAEIDRDGDGRRRRLRLIDLAEKVERDE